MAFDAAPPIIEPMFDSSLLVDAPLAQVINAVAATGNDGFVVAGQTTAAIDFGMGPLQYAGGEDAFVASYSASGTLRWARTFGGAGDDTPFDVTADAAGNAYVTGLISSDVDFGGGVRSTIGGEDIFIASYDRNGTHRWSRIIGSTTPAGEIGFGIEMEGDAVYATGWFRGSTDFGDATRTSSDTEQDVFMLVANATDGTTRFSRAFGGPLLDQGQKLAISPDGRIALAGLFAGTSNFGNGDIASAGSHDAFVVMLDSNGAPTWSRTAGQANSDRGQGIDFGLDGDVYACGEYFDRIDFLGVATTSFGLEDAFVARFASDGTPLWIAGYGGSNTERGMNCEVAPDGSVLVAATFASPTITLGDTTLTNAGNVDFVVAAFAPTGALAWHKRFGDVGTDGVRDIAIDPLGVVYLAGATNSAIDFGDGVHAPNGSAGFVVRLRPNR